MSLPRLPHSSVPVERDGSVYVSRNVLVKAGDANQPAQYFRHLVALDASTGQERWRYPASPSGTVGLCMSEALVTHGTYFAVSGVTLCAIGRTHHPPPSPEACFTCRVTRPIDPEFPL